MKEAVGNSLIINIMIIVISLIMLFFTATLAYSKAFKIKNRIVNIIEERNGYTPEATTDIETALDDVGYQVRDSSTASCDADEENGGKLVSTDPLHRYCVIEYNNNGYRYYRVTTYMSFDFPFINQLLEFPVNGETRRLDL